MMTIVSGSSGNCTFVGSDKTSVLVDAGCSKKKINNALKEFSYDLRDISGILITHEHIDHIKALGVISRSYGIKMYATQKTIEQIKLCNSLGEYDRSLFCSIEPDVSFDIGDITITPHSIWHDAADPVCYCMENSGKKVCVATDIGDYDEYLVAALKDMDAMLIEANHDIRMLQVGPYPYELKQRILGKRGHLSNEASGSLIKSILNNHIKGIYLGHLSHENNYPELAYETVKLAISDNPFSKDIRDFNLNVAKREEHSEMLCV